jgi:hypothetical protein
MGSARALVVLVAVAALLLPGTAKEGK